MDDTMTISQRSFQEVFKKNIQRILNYWTQISVILGLGATALGFLVLYTYTQSINRLDLFMISIDVKTSLAIWIILVLGSIVAYLFALTVTTWMFGMSVSLFMQIPEDHKYVARWLLIPVLSGFIVFVTLNFFAIGKISPGYSILSIAIFSLISCFVLAEFQGFRSLIIKNLQNQNTPPGVWNEAVFILLLSTLVFVCITTGIFPTLLTLHAYTGEDTEAAVIYVAGLTIINIFLTICPIIIFYWANGDIYKRAFYAVSAAAFVLIISLTMSPGALTNMTYGVAGNLEVRRHQVERFVLSEDLALKDFDSALWKTRLNDNNRVEILGYQLYSFGDVLLICPTDLLTLNRKELMKYSHFCLSTLNSKVIRKPIKPRTIISNPTCDIPKTWKAERKMPSWAKEPNTSCLNRYMRYAAWRLHPENQ